MKSRTQQGQQAGGLVSQQQGREPTRLQTPGQRRRLRPTSRPTACSAACNRCSPGTRAPPCGTSRPCTAATAATSTRTAVACRRACRLDVGSTGRPPAPPCSLHRPPRPLPGLRQARPEPRHLAPHRSMAARAIRAAAIRSGGVTGAQGSVASPDCPKRLTWPQLSSPATTGARPQTMTRVRVNNRSP